MSPGNLPMLQQMNSAEDVSDSMSCWDAWKETVNKKDDAGRMDACMSVTAASAPTLMSGMLFVTSICNGDVTFFSETFLNSPTLRRGTQSV